MNICVVITARASYARIKTALEAIQAHPDMTLQVVTAASAQLERYGNVSEIMERDGFPSWPILSVVEGGSPEAMVKGTGLLTMELGSFFAKTRPDAVVTIADRHETLATAIAASYQNIPLVHVQGGEVTGSIDDRVRNAVTELAGIHYAATVKAAEEIDRRLHSVASCWTGCPSIDLAARAQPLQELHVGAGAEIDLSKPFLIVLQHPVTTEYNQAGHQIKETIEAVRCADIPAVWFWPNVDAGTDAVSKALRVWHETNPPVRFVRNLEPEEFCGLAKRASAVVGNSSFGIREASFLGLPAVNIGTRQDSRERGGNVFDVPHDSGKILSAIKSALSSPPFAPSYLYGDGRAGERIAEYLAEELGKRRAA